MAQAAIPGPSLPLLAALGVSLQAVEHGVGIDTIATFAQASGIPLKDIYEVVIPARTLKHRRDRAQNLSRDESDKLARLIRVFDHAVRVFGSVEKASRWLSKPKQRFEGRTPLDVLRTETGGRLVDELIWQIADGVFA